MSGGVEIKLDTREFRRAMADYLAVTKKDAAHGVNRQVRNICFKAAQKVKLSPAGAIRGLASEDWWPKIVAGVMRKRAGGQAASDIYQAQWAMGKKKARDKQLGKGQKAFMLDKKEKSFAREAAKISKALIGNRVKAIGFTKWFFLKVARRISTQVNLALPGGKEFGGVEATVIPATMQKLYARFDSVYKFKRRGSRSAESEMKELSKALNLAVPAAVKDMHDYVVALLAKRSREYSGRPA
jgi:hypothetical protein